MSLLLDPNLSAMPTLWGLKPAELHDRFWAARGVQVVRPGDTQGLSDRAELYLLVGGRAMVLFQLRELIDALSWLMPQIMFVRIRDERDPGCRERIVTDGSGAFVGFQRVYHRAGPRSQRVALTASRDLARAWQQSSHATQAWRQVRALVPRAKRVSTLVMGSVFDRGSDHDLMALTKRLVEVWDRPGAAITGIRSPQRDVWTAGGSRVAPHTRFVGAAWIGDGRNLEGQHTLVGPSVLWDDPAARRTVTDVPWAEIFPTDFKRARSAPREINVPFRRGKRLFDIVFSLFALAVTLPLYPFIMLAIILEDGWPVFFSHRRETLGGRTFPCLKFRSMRRDAEAMKKELAKQNKADGPQFFIERDPRLTRVGAFLRKTNLDELPQFINVLLGHMSIVGPRPSPYSENQFCPGWRNARLSTRPGITGLWQVMRSRQTGLDFQEWIKYDIAYVENMSFKLDLWIIWKTVGVLLRGLVRR
jgi:lipopolysaccharide/colanic/teichoic acid biosynthesis glycosyltransferase